MAFQVADDLLDYTASEAMTGKPTGLDLREHKVTLPLIYALRALTPVRRSCRVRARSCKVVSRHSSRPDSRGQPDRHGVSTF